MDDDTLEQVVRFYSKLPFYHQPSENQPAAEKQLQKRGYSKLRKMHFHFIKKGNRSYLRPVAWNLAAFRFLFKMISGKGRIP